MVCQTTQVCIFALAANKTYFAASFDITTQPVPKTTLP
jgi:hypothetical protein